MKDMGKAEALAIVMGIAMRWGLNAEEAFRERIESDFTDEKLAEIVRMPDGEVSEEELTDAKDLRDLWCALDVLYKMQLDLPFFQKLVADAIAKPSAERSAEEVAAIARAMET